MITFGHLNFLLAIFTKKLKTLPFFCAVSGTNLTSIPLFLICTGPLKLARHFGMWSSQNISWKAGTIYLAYNLSTWEVKERRSQVDSQSRLHSDFENSLAPWNCISREQTGLVQAISAIVSVERKGGREGEKERRGKEEGEERTENL